MKLMSSINAPLAVLPGGIYAYSYFRHFLRLVITAGNEKRCVLKNKKMAVI